MKSVSASRVLALVLVFLMVFSMLPMSLVSMTVSAAGTPAVSGAFQIELDCDTSTNIPINGVAGNTGGFGHPASDGMIWTDKSVTQSLSGPDRLQINLSALAQEYVTEEMADFLINAPAADVLLILDTSASMNEFSLSDVSTIPATRAHASMVRATNYVIDYIQRINDQNRVMVTGFGLTVNTILPMGRYTPRITDSANGFTAGGGSLPVYISTTASGGTSPFTLQVNELPISNPASLSAGTSTQAGVSYAFNLMMDAINGTTGAAADTERIPFVMILSDGGANESYNE